ncbi:hypothetical protein Btus_0885 [Kyrpidia tusciae DSM 2912]|uniref:Uncharacterized protein n=1 Tax=Kyrpidia tusciae (strain DSM 2912 / NBRC 15312 / T2) TaxID=562970 RepID=D5WVZ7_KYRT2|nr:hypothetical protein Btus_0885 [Kyrpidia tusciae DSM 2912]
MNEPSAPPLVECEMVKNHTTKRDAQWLNIGSMCPICEG